MDASGYEKRGRHSTHLFRPGLPLPLHAGTGRLCGGGPLGGGREPPVGMGGEDHQTLLRGYNPDTPCMPYLLYMECLGYMYCYITDMKDQQMIADRTNFRSTGYCEKSDVWAVVQAGTTQSSECPPPLPGPYAT